MITINHLYYSIGNKKILNGIDFVFEPGKFYAVAGPNGSGKSTLLKCLCGLETNHTGVVALTGKPLDNFPHKQRACIQTYVAQQSHAGFDFTVKEFVMMGRFPHQGNFATVTPDDMRMCAKVMADTDIFQLKDQSVRTLSGGEYQRVVIARALMQDTPLVYLDEPFSQLDLYHQSAMLQLFKNLCQTQGKTVICVLHDFNQMLAYADCVLLLNNGMIVAHGAPYRTLTPAIISHVYHVETAWANFARGNRPGLLPMMPTANPLNDFTKVDVDVKDMVN